MTYNEGAGHYKGLEHGSTVIVCKDTSEMFYVLKWAERVGKKVAVGLYCRTVFPVYLSTAGNGIGWTDRSDRALYYKPFSEFTAELQETPE